MMTASSFPSLSVAAIKYAKGGYHVFPLRQKDKKPITTNGLKDASKNPELVRSLWNGRSCNIGLRTGHINGFFVVDVDDPEAWDQLLGAHGGEMPLTPRVQTSKGFHLYFAIPEGANIGNRTKVAGCFDVRGDGGYVVAPPSIHPDESQYTFINLLSETPLPLPPQWLLDLILQKKPNEQPKQPSPVKAYGSNYGLAALEDECALVARTGEGSRNNTLNSAAFSIGQLVGGGELMEQDARNALLNAAIACGLPETEAKRTLDSGLDDGKQEPRSAPEKSITLHADKQGTQLVPSIEWSPPKPIKNSLLPVESFTPELLPEPLRDFVADLSERKDNAPIDYAAVGVMVALGAMLGRKIAVHPKRHDDWLVVPNLWGGVVGRPSMKKTPTLEDAISPMRKLEAESKGDFDAAEMEYQAAMKLDKIQQKNIEREATKLVKQAKHSDAQALLLSATEETPQPPARRRYILNNATVEKLGEILSENPIGILLYRDELTGWLTSMDREDGGEDRAFYLESWNGTGRFTYDRIGRGTVDIESCTVSVLGGIQPGKLQPYLLSQRKGDGDDGLIERLQLLVYPDPNAFKHIDRSPNREAQRGAYAEFEKLAAIPYSGAEIPSLRFSDDAQDLFDEWYCDLSKRAAAESNRHIESHLCKYASLMPSLALIIHVTQQGTDAPVSQNAAAKAAAWCDYLESHARRIYALADDPLYGARSLVKHLRKLPNPFQTKDFSNQGWAGLNGQAEIHQALSILCERGYLHREEVKTDTKPKTLYHINPAVRED